jgi:hypothetical protein
MVRCAGGKLVTLAARLFSATPDASKDEDERCRLRASPLPNPRRHSAHRLEPVHPFSFPGSARARRVLLEHMHFRRHRQGKQPT